MCTRGSGYAYLRDIVVACTRPVRCAYQSIFWYNITDGCEYWSFLCLPELVVVVLIILYTRT